MRIVYAVSMTTGCAVVPFDFLARIEGAVIRLPGSGDGVALLVEFSMVKVDMRPASSRRNWLQPVPVESRLVDNGGTLTAICSSAGQVRWRPEPAWMEVEFSMIDRHWLGDLGLAILLALPLAALAEPVQATHTTAGQLAPTHLPAGDRLSNDRVGLLG